MKITVHDLRLDQLVGVFRSQFDCEPVVDPCPTCECGISIVSFTDTGAKIFHFASQRVMGSQTTPTPDGDVMVELTITGIETRKDLGLFADRFGMGTERSLFMAWASARTRGLWPETEASS